MMEVLATRNALVDLLFSIQIEKVSQVVSSQLALSHRLWRGVA